MNLTPTHSPVVLFVILLGFAASLVSLLAAPSSTLQRPSRIMPSRAIRSTQAAAWRRQDDEAVAAASLQTEKTAAGDGVNPTATVEVNPPPVPLPSVVSPPSAPNLTSLLTGHVGQDVGHQASSEMDIRFQDVEQVDDSTKSPKKKKSKKVKFNKRRHTCEARS